MIKAVINDVTPAECELGIPPVEATSVTEAGLLNKTATGILII